MKQTGLYELKAKLSAVLAEVQAKGEPVAITRHGRIIAELHPHHPQIPLRKRGCLKSDNFVIADDFDNSEVGFEDFFGDSPNA
jgi:antitoxin (DNA-binding transcriptional repressor) of toxin-antitoxin stability system